MWFMTELASGEGFEIAAVIRDYWCHKRIRVGVSEIRREIGDGFVMGSSCQDRIFIMYRAFVRGLFAKIENGS